ncbi:hypothetical protein TCAP_04012 [Tolypocladium capitatum]|uniref:Uncharacterized protein n=1 Tax=Tolypocladium capitatum TaxID=45235 RepID=A0A2K3QEV7_9HYPO|nr:hypothetical protein TCAP_04012 [Tolypocladium capitatum]
MQHAPSGRVVDRAAAAPAITGNGIRGRPGVGAAPAPRVFNAGGCPTQDMRTRHHSQVQAEPVTRRVTMPEPATCHRPQIRAWLPLARTPRHTRAVDMPDGRATTFETGRARSRRRRSGRAVVVLPARGRHTLVVWPSRGVVAGIAVAGRVATFASRRGLGSALQPSCARPWRLDSGGALYASRQRSSPHVESRSLLTGRDGTSILTHHSGLNRGVWETPPPLSPRVSLPPCGDTWGWRHRWCETGPCQTYAVLHAAQEPAGNDTGYICRHRVSGIEMDSRQALRHVERLRIFRVCEAASERRGSRSLVHRVPRIQQQASPDSPPSPRAAKPTMALPIKPRLAISERLSLAAKLTTTSTCPATTVKPSPAWTAD